MPRKNIEHKISAQKPKPIALWPLYVVLALLIILYSLQNNIWLGFGAFVIVVIIIAIIAKEVKDEVKEKGGKEGIREIIIAIGAAIGIWVLLIFILQTSSPINAVASCSMLPNLQKGDMVVLHGIINFSQFLNTNHVPIVNVGVQDIANMQSNMNSEFLAFYPYFNNNKSMLNPSMIIPPNASSYGIGLYNTQCIARYVYLKQLSNLGLCYVGQNPASNLIKYNYSIGVLTYKGAGYRIVQTNAITIKNTTITENFSNPIIVYSTTSQDTFSGPIIHRLVAVLYANNTYYTLTRGDNNPALDMQFGNYPARQSDLLGYVLANVPLLGYFKLIISGQIGSTPGCDQVITKH